MDGTSTIIVVLLFVVTMFQSFGGNTGYTARPTPPPTTPKQVSQPAKYYPKGKIDPSYTPALVKNPRTSIQNYVAKYRKPAQALQITDSIMKHSKKYNVNPKLVTALIRRESRFNPRAISKSGAVGLGQLMPATCKTTGVKNPYDIDDNAKGTTRYMKYLLDKFKNYSDQVSFALAGYLEGPNAVARKKGYRSSTGKYVKDILNIYHKL